MRSLFRVIDMVAYRGTLLWEDLGWVAFRADGSFSVAHKVFGDPVNGPIIIIGDEVFEVDIDGPVFSSKREAEAAFYVDTSE